jgi:phage shock protein PspC (stress-responsive transcriptional regulator)
MKEITRIHIAKVPYDAEIEAKKELESYLRTLEAYSNDTEIINDIEIRITEILAGRGVNKNGVITLGDVKALKEQLGEPKDFMADGDIAIGPEDNAQVGSNSRKLFRDVDNAVLGGVMSGIGAFFGINPLWVRLLFIIVALASFGTALLVYIILWIVVPPAKTAADKLQMAGRSVTIASIREINENESVQSDRTSSGRRILTVIAGIIAVFAALGSVILVAGATVRVLVTAAPNNIWDSSESGFFVPAFILAVVSGLLLTALFVLVAFAAFTQKITRRVLLSAIIVVVLGLASFGTGVGLAQYGATLRRQAVEANTHEVSIQLPSTIKTATALDIKAPGFKVRYIVDSEQPNARMRVITDKTTAVPNVSMVMDGTTLKLNTDGTTLQDVCYWPGCDGFLQQIIIYGPAMDAIATAAGSQVNYSAANQSKLVVTTKKDTRFAVDSGTVDTLTVNAEDTVSISAADATITHAKLTFSNSASISLGTVQTLDITHTDSCPAGKQSQVEIWNAKGLTINGATQSVKTASLTCMTLIIEGENNDRS